MSWRRGREGSEELYFQALVEEHLFVGPFISNGADRDVMESVLHDRYADVSLM